ncbi:Regulator_of chromosome condensation 1/beta-lactamase-inhibitor protein II [Hexamita inflata]|uniref:Regulator of chromosome condensation 1/beta-lactamase-inhibitor protein II n=1 Tax=Hexamita inflata TaxID=28002 RepID=A0AA86PIX2_9EUKA|nr:Regulator of chromosome condensation 1/beta-lactamase-inhibitor protein II [Hexamita inflata]
MLIAIVTYESAFVQKFKYPYGSLLSQISNSSNLIDIVIFKDAIYQLLENGTVQALGNKPSLLGNKQQYQFVNTELKNFLKLYFYKDLYLWYISTKNELFFETYDYNDKKTVFTQSLKNIYLPTGIPLQNIKQIVGNDLLQFVLTSSAIYITGTQNVQYIFNGNSTGLEESYLKLPLILNASNIVSIDLTKSMSYLFIYMNNGDVYALGDNTQGILTVADNKCERKVGTNITRVSVSYNHTRKQMTMYYLESTNLYLYDQSTNKVLVQDYVFDYQKDQDYQIYGQNNQQKNTIIIGNQSIINYSEDVSIYIIYRYIRSYILYKNGTDYFCSINKQNPRCVLQLNGEDTDCYINKTILVNKTFCHIWKCYQEGSCPTTQSCPGAQAFNISCQAVACINNGLQNIFTPECAQTNINHTYSSEFVNSSQLSFVNGLLFTKFSTPSYPDAIPTKTKQNMSIVAVAGITVGICAFAFIIIFTSIMCYNKRKQYIISSKSQTNTKKVNTQLQVKNKTHDKQPEMI